MRAVISVSICNLALAFHGCSGGTGEPVRPAPDPSFTFAAPDTVPAALLSDSGFPVPRIRQDTLDTAMTLPRERELLVSPDGRWAAIAKRKGPHPLTASLQPGLFILDLAGGGSTFHPRPMDEHVFLHAWVGSSYVLCSFMFQEPGRAATCDTRYLDVRAETGGADFAYPSGKLTVPQGLHLTWSGCLSTSHGSVSPDGRWIAGWNAEDAAEAVDSMVIFKIGRDAFHVLEAKDYREGNAAYWIGGAGRLVYGREGPAGELEWFSADVSAVTGAAAAALPPDGRVTSHLETVVRGWRGWLPSQSGRLGVMFREEGVNASRLELFDWKSRESRLLAKGHFDPVFAWVGDRFIIYREIIGDAMRLKALDVAAPKP